MYKMKADGVVFYDPSADDMTLQVLSPKATFELNKAGSLTFTVLPGNVMYDGLHKLKTVITLEQDDEIVFRGRVLETATDLYNQKEVYCEGELAFLLDSLVRPYDFKGKAADLFRQLVTAHNEQVEEYKRFEIGIITAVDDEDETEVKGDSYADTLAEISSLLIEEHGGYLRVRRDGGVRYLDYVDEFGQSCSQEINFGVNLVDIENKVSAQDVFTVLVPLGKQVSNKFTTIAKVNGGKDYIEDAEAIEKYGRIIKTHTWDEVSDPEQLLTFAQEYMDKMKAETTLTITAVDLHACGVDVDGIHLGDTVHLRSLPHGLDRDEVCTCIDFDIENPEKSEYTFGLPQETLTESHANAVKRLSSSINDQHRWLTETDTALNITVETVNLIGHRTTQLEIDVDAAEQAITMKASQDSVDILEEKHTEVVLRLDAAEGAITAKADTVRVEALETEIKGLLKAEDLEAQIASIGDLHVGGSVEVPGNITSDSLWVNGTATLDGGILTGKVDATGVDTLELTVNGTDYSAHSHKVTVNDDGTVTLGEVSSTGGSFRIADTAYYKSGVSAARESVTLSSAGWVNGTCVVNASNGKSHTVNLPPFSTSGGTSFVGNKTTVYFYTDGINIPLKSVEVDATSVYDAGYEAGYQAAKDAVQVTAGISWSNPAQNYARVSYWGRATIDGEQVGYYSSSDSKDISGYV